jgi:hypothetical protein
MKVNISINFELLETIYHDFDISNTKYEYLNLIIVCLLIFIIFSGKIRLVPNGFPYPSNETNFVSFLKQKIQFNVGDNFNGRFLNLLPVEYLDKGHINNIDNNTLMAVSAVGLRLVQEEFNDLSFSNLREFNIPVSIEHNRMSNPFTVIFNNFLMETIISGATLFTHSCSRLQ